MKKYKITKNWNLRVVIIIILSIILIILSSILFAKTSAETQPVFSGNGSILSTEKVDIINPIKEVVSNIASQTVEELKLLHPIVNVTPTNDYVYTTESLRYRIGPGTTYEILGIMPSGEEIYRIGICENGWSKVFIDNLECFMSTDYLSVEPPKPATPSVSTLTYATYSPEYLMNMGVVYDGGWRYTWYSERVLPGGGLNIPGRWSDGNFVRDENGYICVASSDLAKGTILETPWGTAKVYDCGCASGTIDMYVSW